MQSQMMKSTPWEAERREKSASRSMAAGEPVKASSKSERSALYLRRVARARAHSQSARGLARAACVARV